MASSNENDAKMASSNENETEVSRSKVNYFSQLPMLIEKKTEMYVKFAKVMLIFQGPSSKERRDVVHKLAEKFKQACRVINDDSYAKETGNFFDPGKTEQFYDYMKRETQIAFETGFNLIVIDPSMSYHKQMLYYLYFAQKTNYVCLVLPPFVTESRAQQHNAPKTQAASFFREHKVEIRHINNFEHYFCGWYLHDVDSALLREEAGLYVQDCFDNIPEFRSFFAKVCTPEMFNIHYNMVDRRQDLACCIVTIFNNVACQLAYFKKECVRKFYGKMSKLFIVGFIISPHMVAARVKLTHIQKELWDLPDDLDENSKLHLYPSEIVKGSKVNLENVTLKLIGTKSNRTLISADSTCNPLENILPYAKARSCHIVLGKGSEAPVRNIDYDVPFAVRRERIALKSTSADIEVHDVGRAVVRRFGKYWIIYLKESIAVDGFFASCCKAVSHETYL